MRDNELYTSVYSKAHYRGSGYLVGVLAGYAVFKWRSTQLSKVCTMYTSIVMSLYISAKIVLVSSD